MDQSALTPDFRFLERAEAAGPFNAAQCFQCRKCTNGCPASFEMDLFPDQVIRLAILGQRNEVLHSKTIWICASCETCTTRCPNGVRIAEMMDYFKEVAILAGVTPAEPHVAALHQAFLKNVRLTGRVFEPGLLPIYWAISGQLRDKLLTGDLRDEIKQGIGLLARGRLAVMPEKIKGKREISALLR